MKKIILITAAVVVAITGCASSKKADMSRDREQMVLESTSMVQVSRSSNGDIQDYSETNTGAEAGEFPSVLQQIEQEKLSLPDRIRELLLDGDSGNVYFLGKGTGRSRMAAMMAKTDAIEQYAEWKADSSLVMVPASTQLYQWEKPDGTVFVLMGFPLDTIDE